MKEKRKGYPRRRFLGLALMVFLLLGGYFALPYAQNAFVAWWEDDPFTPLCDVPEYGLTVTYGYGDSSRLYRLNGNSTYEELGYVYNEWDFSPNERWFNWGYSTREEEIIIYDKLSSQPVYRYNSPDAGNFFWLYDNQLIYIDGSSRQWQIYDPESNHLESISQSPDLEFSSRILSSKPLSGDNYFLASESINENGLTKRELVSYDHSLSRRILHSFSVNDTDEASIYGTVSPDGRYFSYYLQIKHSGNQAHEVSLWWIDLEVIVPQEISSGGSDSPSFVWSPDSLYLAYYFSRSSFLSFYDRQIRENVFVYVSSAQRINLLEWNIQGIWLYEYDDNLSDKSIISWGNFADSRLSLERTIDDITGARPLDGSDNLIISQTYAKGDDVAFSLILLNSDGESEWQIDNTFNYDYAEQSHDNHYLSYRSINNWIYIFDFESERRCKAVKLEENRFISYSWYSLPQP